MLVGCSDTIDDIASKVGASQWLDAYKAQQFEHVLGTWVHTGSLCENRLEVESLVDFVVTQDINNKGPNTLHVIQNTLSLDNEMAQRLNQRAVDFIASCELLTAAEESPLFLTREIDSQFEYFLLYQNAQFSLKLTDDSITPFVRMQTIKSMHFERETSQLLKPVTGV